ncbi:MAG: hypothetical protein ACLUKD_15255, partial [Eggerthella lenta]
EPPPSPARGGRVTLALTARDDIERTTAMHPPPLPIAVETSFFAQKTATFDIRQPRLQARFRKSARNTCSELCRC